MRTDLQTSLRQMEERLSSLPLVFLPNRSKVWEQAAFPNMAAIYWNLARSSNVPEQALFAESVAAQLDQSGNADVLARAYRAYPALVRQHHFFLVLKEHFPVVVRSEELDLGGVDLLVVEDGRAYGIALSVQTPSAHSWQEIKQRRHPDSPGHLPMLYLYAKADEYVIGRFWLHHPDQWLEVRRFIENERFWEDQRTAYFLSDAIAY